jgi:hypothetical protein
MMADVPLWFSLTAQRSGRDVCLIWRDGKLFCDDERVIELVKTMARQSSGPPTWLPLPADMSAGALADCYWARFIMGMIMGTKAVMRGRLPPIPGPPPGAIT